MTYQRAVGYCHQLDRGATLATFASDAELTALDAILDSTNSFEKYYIGATLDFDSAFAPSSLRCA